MQLIFFCYMFLTYAQHNLKQSRYIFFLQNEQDLLYSVVYLSIKKKTEG